VALVPYWLSALGLNATSLDTLSLELDLRIKLVADDEVVFLAGASFLEAGVETAAVGGLAVTELVVVEWLLPPRRKAGNQDLFSFILADFFTLLDSLFFSCGGRGGGGVLDLGG
jgi:hypothetical protein